jgi:hypothetical protein
MRSTFGRAICSDNWMRDLRAGREKAVLSSDKWRYRQT